MNLFHDPSILGLRQLVDTADKSLPVHNIVIDYDGEVIIDPEKKFAHVSLNRFKFHTKVHQSVKNNARCMKILFETLVNAYNSSPAIISMNKKLKWVA